MDGNGEFYDQPDLVRNGGPGRRNKHSIPKYQDVAHLFNDPVAAEEFLMDEGCFNIPEHCEQCGEPITCTPNKKKLIRCGRRACIHENGNRFSRSVTEGTFFMGCRIPLNEMVHFLWLFCCGVTHTFLCSHFGWSSATVTNWMLFVRQLIGEMVLLHHDAIGGPGTVVEIDESKFGKRKHNRGHRVDGVWVFGGVERTPERRCFLVKVPNRNRTALYNLIHTHILPGSLIRSDKFSSYFTIEQIEGHFYEHEMVNHSETHVDPDTGCHTNTIEGTWNGVKVGVPVRKRTWKHVQNCLHEFTWRRQNAGRLWEAMIDALRTVRFLSHWDD